MLIIQLLKWKEWEENLLNFSFSGMIMKNYFCSIVKGRIVIAFRLDQKEQE